jgi:drug/metabolite transporter (DMT)-like permease
MVAVTALWGWTFVVVKGAIEVYPPLAFLGARFALAALLLVGFAIRNRGSARAGAVLGALLAAGYLAQTFGLRRVSPSTAGLLTGMFVVFTPAADAALFRVRPHGVTVLAAAVAVAGLVLLTAGAGGQDQPLGVAMELACAVAFAFHIAYLSRHSAGHRSTGLAAWQMVTCALLFVGAAGATRTLARPPAAVLGPILVCGAGASALAFFAQTYVQRHLDASRTALLLTAEPAFAVLFGVLLAGDPLSPRRAAGAALILAALAGHEVLVARRLASPLPQVK